MLRSIWRLTSTLILLSLAMPIVGAPVRQGAFEYQVIVPDKSFFPSYAWPKVPAYLVVDSVTDWAKFWGVPGRLELPPPNVGHLADEAPRIPDPKVDFGHFTLLLVTDGPKPTSGYSTSISSVWDMGTKIIVTVINVRPIYDAACAVLPVDTNPTVVALIPKANKPVVFDVIEATTNVCSGHRAIAGGQQK
jgi:hypothetical protein